MPLYPNEMVPVRIDGPMGKDGICRSRWPAAAAIRELARGDATPGLIETVTGMSSRDPGIVVAVTAQPPSACRAVKNAAGTSWVTAAVVG